MTTQWIDNLETGKDKPPESLHKQGVVKTRAELRTETRRIQRRQQRLQPPPPPIWIELIEWDDWSQDQPTPPPWVELIEWDDWSQDQPTPPPWVELIEWDDRSQTPPPLEPVAALPNPFS